MGVARMAGQATGPRTPEGLDTASDGAMLSAMLQASPERLAHDLDVLANDIGVRLAGTAGERAAADYISARAREIGVDTWEETFPVQSRVVAEEQLEVLMGGAWRRFPCSLHS